MFSITPSEVITIGIIALIVIGPQRLPRLARQAGKMTRQLRRAADSFKEDLGSDYEDTVRPFREAASDISATGKSLRETVEGQLRWVDDAATEASDAITDVAGAASAKPEPPPSEPEKPPPAPGPPANPEEPG